MSRTVIPLAAILFAVTTYLEARYPFDGATRRSYGYIWNLDLKSLSKESLEQTHGERNDPPDWKEVYGPVPVKIGNRYEEQWQRIWVQW